MMTTPQESAPEKWFLDAHSCRPDESLPDSGVLRAPTWFPQCWVESVQTDDDYFFWQERPGLRSFLGSILRDFDASGFGGTKNSDNAERDGDYLVPKNQQEAEQTSQT